MADGNAVPSDFDNQFILTTNNFRALNILSKPDCFFFVVAQVFERASKYSDHFHVDYLFTEFRMQFCCVCQQNVKTTLKLICRHAFEADI